MPTLGLYERLARSTRREVERAPPAELVEAGHHVVETTHEARLFGPSRFVRQFVQPLELGQRVANAVLFLFHALLLRGIVACRMRPVGPPRQRADAEQLPGVRVGDLFLRGARQVHRPEPVGTGLGARHGVVDAE